MLGATVVHVWRVPLDAPATLLPRLWLMLDHMERARARGLLLHRDRVRFVVAHAALRTILAHYLQQQPSEVCFQVGVYGKPMVAGTLRPRLDFNLAHSADLAVCAVARDREVGIDLERIQPTALDDLAQRFFSPAEQAALGALPPAQRVLGFFQCWTRKEAYLKADGHGLALPLDSFDVSVAPGAPAAVLAVRGTAHIATDWSLRELDVGAEYSGAIAALGGDWQLERYHWSWDAAPTTQIVACDTAIQR